MQLLQLGGLMACLPAWTQIAHVGVSSQHLLKLKIFAERKVTTGFFFLPLFSWFYWVKEKPINRVRFNHLPNTWTQGLLSKEGGLVWKETWPTSSKSTLERVPYAHVMYMYPVSCPGKILSEWNGCFWGHQGNRTFNLCSICSLIYLDWPCSERNQIWLWLRNPYD